MNDDPRKAFEKAIDDLDTRLGGLLGALGSTISEVLARLDAQEGAEWHRVEEIETARGPLRAEAGVRIRLAGAGTGDGQRSRSFGVRAAPTGGADARRTTAGATPDPAAAGDTAGKAPATVADRAAATHAPPPRPVHLEHYTEAGRWIVCGDLPGVTLPEVSLRIEVGPGGRCLHIATSGARVYAGTLDVPGAADTATMEAALRNGVLEIAMDLAPAGDPKT